MIPYEMNGFCWTGDQAMYDPLGDTLATAGNKALAGDQAMFDPLGDIMVTAGDSSGWGPGNV